MSAGPALVLWANPESGGGTDADDLERRLTALTARITRVEDAGQLADAARGADRIVVAGGDGSVAPAAEQAARAGVPVAVVATGTANDFARAARLPVDLDGACRLAVQGERVRSYELGRKDARPFVNVCSAGLAVAAAGAATSFKGALGPLAYAVGALRAGLKADPIECAVACDGRAFFAGSAWQVVIACTGAFGGGSEIGVADPRDGELDVAVIESGPRAHLLRHAYGLRAGHVTEQRGVRHARGSEVEFDGKAAFNLDGELTEPTARASFRVEPGAFDLVIG
ncbi:MAG: diacylglycerol kinase family protein [Thermoleophilaceae bacterium]